MKFCKIKEIENPFNFPNSVFNDNINKPVFKFEKLKQFILEEKNLT